jgi:hypothetical protein
MAPFRHAAILVELTPLFSYLHLKRKSRGKPL